MEIRAVVEAAKEAKANGASRFCMGAAWKKLRDGKDLDSVIEMIKEVNYEPVGLGERKFPKYFYTDKTGESIMSGKTFYFENAINQNC